MLAESQHSWLGEFAIPAFFTFFGAALGFAASQLRDAWTAKRDKNAFLRAVGMELDALSHQLDASFDEVKRATEKVTGGGTGPHFAAAMRNSVFTSQLGKLRDVDDPLLIKLIHFYSDLGTLQRVVETVNDLANEYNRADLRANEKASIRPRLESGLKMLQEQIAIFANRLRDTRAKLPPAEMPKQH